MMNNHRGNGFGGIANLTDRVLEITVISGEDLQIKGKPIGKNAYAVVRTDNLSNIMTKVDQEGGSYPSWNEKFLVDLPLHACFIIVEVRQRTSSSGEGQLIGGANIPVADFIGGYAPENYLHFLSYRLRDAVGERNGIVNVSVRVRSPAFGCSTSSSKSEMSIPMERRNGRTDWTVTGVPIWFPQACRS